MQNDAMPYSSQPPSTNPKTDALAKLYDRTLDSMKGYATMVEKAEPSFRNTAEQFRTLHARHADVLARLLADLGVEPDGDGSLMGTVNKAVVSLRALVDEIDEDVMDQVRNGEDWVLKAFDAAIEEQEASATTARLREMRAELVDLLDATRTLG
jgi:uncharacterized protein (TIGR02284 family)